MPASLADTLERDPLELRSLVEPEAVLREIPAELVDAQLSGDTRRQALLHLAQANACRVVANWDCQREAGRLAQAAAREVGAVHLVVRGLIAESRGRLAMQDYTRGGRLLAEAELLLQAQPQAELFADVMLAYSSMSHALAKHSQAQEYAERGISALGEGEGLAMRARLLRNLARVKAGQGQIEQANLSLKEATSLSETLGDPKLEAELYLESARVARIVGDRDTQRRNGERVIALANGLKNSQLLGLGHEVLGLAAADAGDGDAARRQLGVASGSFRMLELQSDELRVVRELVKVLLRFEPAGDELPRLFQRYLVLDNAIRENERTQAADEFDSRLRYAERENEVARLQAESALAQAREEALARNNRLIQVLALLGALLLAVLGVFFVLQRRSNRSLRELVRQLGESELQYRTLADNASDLVIRAREDGTRLYVSPSSQEMLGLTAEQMLAERWETVHPDDVGELRETLAGLVKHGDAATVTYRMRHASGHAVWIESLARRVTGPDGRFEIVCAGRDVSTRVRAEQALELAQSRLRAVTDNIPALISHVDGQERYSFINGPGTAMFGLKPEDAIGKTVREVRGEAIYSEIKPHIDAALRGQRVTFEGQAMASGRQYSYQTSYEPDVGADGVQNGFFTFTFDITQLKDAEQRMERMARFDGLTGLANRRYFDERLAATVARCNRQGTPLALLYLDIDQFKRINDGHGHAAGDHVLREFAVRLRACVREGDLAARIGGDEFILLAEGANSPADAERIAAKILSLMQTPVLIQGASLQVTTSVGIVFARSARDAGQLMAAADGALYQAKAAGRNTSRMVEIG